MRPAGRLTRAGATVERVSRRPTSTGSARASAPGSLWIDAAPVGRQPSSAPHVELLHLRQLPRDVLHQQPSLFEAAYGGFHILVDRPDDRRQQTLQRIGVADVAAKPDAAFLPQLEQHAATIRTRVRRRLAEPLETVSERIPGDADEVWMVTQIAAGSEAGMPATSSRTASIPPAEAPMTTRRFGVIISTSPTPLDERCSLYYEARSTARTA